MSKTIFIRFKNTLLPHTKEKNATHEALKLCDYHVNEAFYDLEDDITFKAKLEDLSRKKIIKKKDIDTIDMLKNSMLVDQFTSDIQYDENGLLKALRDMKKDDKIVVYCSLDKKVIISYLNSTCLSEVVDAIVTLEKTTETQINERFLDNMIAIYAKNNEYVFWDCNNQTVKKNSKKINFIMSELSSENIRKFL